MSYNIIPQSVPPLSPYFLALAFPSILSFTRSSSPQTFLWTVSLLGFLRYLSILSRVRYLSHLIPARPFVTISHTALSAMAGNLSFGMFLTLYCHFNFLTFLFGTFPVLLLINVTYYSQDVNRFFQGFCLEFSMIELISRESDVEYRKQQGLRRTILRCIAVDYRCGCQDERRSVPTTVLDSIPQHKQLSK